MRRLVLVRHGESRWNAEARIQGQRCAGLSEVGHAQARAVAAALVAVYPDATLVTSDLQRTVETVAPLEDVVGRPAARDVRLRERSFGAWEGRLRDEVRAEDAPRWDRWVQGEDVVAEVGGESAEQLADRVAPALQELLDATPRGGVTIAVTHGGPVWHGTHRVLGLVPGTFGGVDNACVTELVALDGDAPGGVEAGRIVLDRWNEVGHLSPALRTGWRGSGSAARAEAGSDGPPVGR